MNGLKAVATEYATADCATPRQGDYECHTRHVVRVRHSQTFLSSQQQKESTFHILQDTGGKARQGEGNGEIGQVIGSIIH